MPGIWENQNLAWYSSQYVKIPNAIYPSVGIGCYSETTQTIVLLEIEYINKIQNNAKGDIEVKYNYIKKIDISSQQFLQSLPIDKPLLTEIENSIVFKNFKIVEQELKNYLILNKVLQECNNDVEFLSVINSDQFIHEKNKQIYSEFKNFTVLNSVIKIILDALINHPLRVKQIGLNDFINIKNSFNNEDSYVEAITNCTLLLKSIDILVPRATNLLEKYDNLNVSGIAHVGRMMGYQLKTYLEFKEYLNQGNVDVNNFETTERSIKNALLYFENPNFYTSYLSEKSREAFYKIFSKNIYTSQKFNTELFDKLLRSYNKEIKLKNKENYGYVFSKFIHKTLTMEKLEDIDNGVKMVNKFSKNLILYGPPGTGKTYHSIDKAVEVVTGFSKTHIENKQIFDQLKRDGQIEFITFHQNYSYEDFVVGIKPDPENELLRFISHKGIFYEITKKARENYYASIEANSGRSFADAFEEIIKPLESGETVKIKMASGIYYTITDVTDSSIRFQKPTGDSVHTLSIQTLESIVEGTRVFVSGLGPYYNPLAELIREKRKSLKTSVKEELKNFVLIIDEINRANISKVFGELITLLEEDKRIGNEMELKVTLPNKEEFSLPPNLYIIGTMNTADKSIALIDIALRRRFEFLGYYPLYEGYDTESAELLKKINNAIYEIKKSADYLIGHAYFMQNLPIELVLQNKIIPLLMEYFSNKTDIVTRLFDNTGWEISYNNNTYNWNIYKL